MGLLTDLKNQFRGVIHWDNPSAGLLFYKFTAHGDEVKNLSKLIIGPGQGAVLVYEGQVESIMDAEGSYDLKTGNSPFITTLSKILQRFESEHKTGIWFYRRADVMNCRWGTVSPIKYLDPAYGFPVSLSAFGNYSMRISNADYFFRNIVAGESHYSVDELRSVLLSRIGQPMSDYLANAKFSYAEIDSNRNAIAAACLSATRDIFSGLGFDVIDFRLEGTGFDNDTLTRIGSIADMTAANRAAREVGLSYVEKEQLSALRDAARNEGGLTGAGVQLGAGAVIGAAFGAGATSQPTDIDAKLTKLKALFDKGLIDEAEYKAKKSTLLDEL
jgi:membrane protease subunit (stomatin/prohibitin family)